MNHDYKKISTNWNKFLAEGAFNLNEDEEPNLVGKRITKPPKKGKGKIVDNILSKLPKPLQSKPMKAALAVGIRAVKDKEVSVKDVWSFVKAATNFAMAGDEESKALAKKQLDAEKVAQLPKVNVDIVFSGLLPVPKDPGFDPPDELTGSRVPAPTGGLASMRLTFEEWLNADESVNLLTEQFVSAKDVGDMLIQLIVKHGKGKIKHAQAKKIFDDLMKIVSPQGRAIGMELDELEKAVIGSIAKIPSR